MPRGSRPGERRGGRQKGTPNKSTALKNAALSAASADPTITPLQFLLGVMRDPQAPTDLRIRVARAAAPLVHGKPGFASPEVGKAGAIDGFIINIEDAKALRDIKQRLSAILRKRYGPSENGGALTDAEVVEESELEAIFHKRAAALESPPGYGESDATKDSERLHQLNCKRLSPPSCGGGELKGADDDEEAILTARVASYRHSSEGRDFKRIRELEFQRICRGLNEHGQIELDELTRKYPNRNANSELASAIRDKLMQLRD